MQRRRSVFVSFLLVILSTTLAFVISPHASRGNTCRLFASDPQNFREAEVLGLKYMQDGEYENALSAFQKGLKLPGSRVDVVRTQRVSGPSPVGGAKGGTNSETVQSLDEFEIQAAYYNMACAQAQLERYDDALASLRVALENGFDNLATIRLDPDLAILPQTDAAAQFDALLEEFESKNNNNAESGGFFRLFQSKKK